MVHTIMSVSSFFSPMGQGSMLGLCHFVVSICYEQMGVGRASIFVHSISQWGEKNK